MTQMVMTLFISFRTPLLYSELIWYWTYFISALCLFVSIHLFNDPILTHVPG